MKKNELKNPLLILVKAVSISSIKRVILGLLVLQMFAYPIEVSALSTDQQNIYDSGIDYFDTISSGAATNCSSTSSSASMGTSSSALVWPFATKDPSQFNRVDQGWDVQAEPGAAVYAIAPGTIHLYNPDPGNFGNDYPTEELDNSIGGDSNFVYYGHVHVLPNLDGQHVSTGQQIAVSNTVYGQNGSGAPPGWLEIGFAKPGTDAPTQVGGGESVATQSGQTMKSLLINAQPVFSSNSSTGQSNTSSQSSNSNLSIPQDFNLKQKIGQLLMVGVTDQNTAAALESKYQIGGFLLNTGFPFSAGKAATGTIRQAGELPPILATDEEGGQVDRLGINLPSAHSMGLQTSDQIQAEGQTAGQALSADGLNIDLAPVADLDNGQNFISQQQRSFSSDPGAVATDASAFAQGLQSSEVVPTFKHFPGIGNASGANSGNTDDNPATTPDLNSLENNDLKPYESLLQGSGAMAVMVGNQKVPGLSNNTPASLSSATYQLLRGKYNFNGLVFTDEIASAGAISQAGYSPTDAVVAAIEAGADMPLINPSTKYTSLDDQISATIDAVVQAVQSGKIQQSSIDASLKRIVDVKNSVTSNSTNSNSSSSTQCCDTSSDANLVGNDNEQKAFNYFVSNGLTAIQAASIVGNWVQESGVNPTAVNSSSGAYGIGQWLGGRLSTLQALPNYDSLSVQLDYAWHELNTSYKSSVLDPLEAITGNSESDLANGVDIVLRNYEVPCGITDDACWSSENSKRLPDAQGILKLYGGDTTNLSPSGSSGCYSSDTTTPIVINGSGSGQFTTDISATPYPGLNKMLAYAQQVAQTAPGPLPQATQDFCNQLPNNTCTLHCESSVEEVWLGHRGVYPNPDTAWQVIPDANKHPGDRNPPVGALLFYTAPGDANGHIAVYLGNNLVFSTDVLGTGSVYIASADKIESAGWNMNYVGWADPYFNGVVGNP